MAVLIKVDEDLPAEIAGLFSNNGADAKTVLDLFSEKGVDAKTVFGQGLSGTSDVDLWPKIQAEGRWFVTADKGFGDLRKYPPGSHAGVILLRLEHESRKGYIHLANEALKSLDLPSIAKSVVIVSPAGIRIRKA